MKDRIKEYGLITISVIVVVLGVYFFKFPSNFSFGGVTGIAVIVSELSAGFVSSGTVVFILNGVLMIVGFMFLGKDFGIKTVYGSLLMSVLLSALEKIYPMTGPLTNEPVLELAFAIALPAFGAALLFNIGASTGGTDIVALLLKKYSSINIGTSLFLTDLLLTLAAFWVFDIQTGLLSFLGLMIKSLVIDTVIENINLCKYFNVVSDNPEPICEYIMTELNRSATVCDAQGAFSQNKKYIIFTVLNRTQGVQLRQFIKKTEPQAFILITNTSEIIGRGFRQ